MTHIQEPSDQKASPRSTARIGAAVGGISVAFSALCFVVTPAFTPAFILAALFGFLSGAIALALKARRTAVVTFVFALTPFCGFLLMQYVAEPLQNGYVVFVPLALAAVFAAWVLINYSKAKRLVASGAA
jgi:hypothetical protein